MYSLRSEQRFIGSLFQAIEINDIKAELSSVNLKSFYEEDFIKQFLLGFALMKNTVLGNDPIDTVLDETH